LDLRFREKLAGVLSALTRGETQICIAASELSEVPEGITHLLVLSQGGVVAQGTKHEVLADEEAVRAIEPARTQPDRADRRAHHLSTRQPVIEMHHVNVTHGDTDVLQEIHWTVHKGDRWALIGPNGAGKTTLLSLILGDHPQAYANRIRLFGSRRGSGESIWEIKRRIGWVAPELHRYYPPRTPCFDVVGSGFYDTLGLYRGCTPSQEDVALSWMARLGIEQQRAHPLYRLSKGQQRLALIARALVKSPELLVLDEPCQGLDAHHRSEVLQAIEEIIRTLETTMIYVSHRREALPQGLTHLLELDGGAIVRQEPLDGQFTGLNVQAS
jgi:molybdate transport system ATP-binding protein